MDNQIPFVYSFSKYNFQLKEAYIHEICMIPPKVGREKENKTQRHFVVEKHKHKCTLQILLVTLEMRNKEKDVNESSEVSKFTRLFPFLVLS